MKTKQTVVLLVMLCILLLGCTKPSKTDSQGIVHPPGKHVTVNGAKLWVEIEGEGEPLLLIAGGPGASHAIFHPYHSVLADEFQLIYFDVFGCGKSDRAQSLGEYTFKRQVEDIEKLRKALGITTWNVLGRSYGGLIAQAYALEYPNVINKLIISSSLFSGEGYQGCTDNENREIMNQFPEVWKNMQNLRADGQNIYAPEYFEATYIPDALFYFYDASNAEKLNFDSEGWNSEVFYAIAGEDPYFITGGDIVSLDFSSRLKELNMPILIIAGRYDRVCIPRYTMQFKTHAPQAEFVMFEKSGHYPFIEETEKTFKLYREFLGTLK